MAALKYGPRIAVIPAGERWRNDRSLRPALEDLIGAGAVIQHLPGRRSPEAQAAWAVYREARPDLDGNLRHYGSGKELIERGFEADVPLAAQLNVSDSAPVLVDGAYVQSAGHDGAVDA
jgi:2-phosphosulfolactate phosphatase